MKFTVGKLSNQSGLAVQTIRAYADRGMIDVSKCTESQYRYFGVNAVNQTSAARRMRMMGFSLDEVSEIMTHAEYERYASMLHALIGRRREDLQYQMDVLTYLDEYEQNLLAYKTMLYQGILLEQPTFYCLDYRFNSELLCQAEAEQELLNEWMAQSVFLRNYSPCPEALPAGEQVDHIIGLLIDERFAKYVRLSAPVYKRVGGRCAAFYIQHDDHMHFLPDGASFALRFLEEHKLRTAGEPFFIGEVPFFENGQKQFYGRLFVPVQDA